MKRLAGQVGSLDGAFEQRPEVLQPVGVYVPVHVGFGMVNDVVDVVAVKFRVERQRIGVKVRAGLNTLANLGPNDGDS